MIGWVAFSVLLLWHMLEGSENEVLEVRDGMSDMLGIPFSQGRMPC